jgi:uncharacterized protein YxeA
MIKIILISLIVMLVVLWIASIYINAVTMNDEYEEDKPYVRIMQIEQKNKS